MSLEFIMIVAAITYGSSAIGLAVLPDLPPRVASTLDRMPPALFAGLAMQALVLPGPEVAGPRVLAAVAGALVVTPLRSLPACLLAGVAAYVAVAVLAA